MPPSDDDSDALYEKLRARMDRERGPIAWLRARPTPVRLSLLAAVALGGVGGLVTMSGASLSPRSSAFAVGLLMLVVLCAITIGTSLRPITAMYGPTGSRILTVAAILLASLGAVAIGSDGSWGDANATRCLVMGGVVGLPVFALVLVLDRTPWRGAIYGALAGGLVGTLAVQLACPSPHLAHLLFGHFGAMLVASALFGTVGWVVARRA